MNIYFEKVIQTSNKLLSNEIFWFLLISLGDLWRSLVGTNRAERS